MPDDFQTDPLRAIILKRANFDIRRYSDTALQQIWPTVVKHVTAEIEERQAESRREYDRRYAELTAALAELAKNHPLMQSVAKNATSGGEHGNECFDLLLPFTKEQ